MIELKNVQNSKFVLGQYFTRPDICDDIVGRIEFGDAVIVEPSFGTGNFLRAIGHLPNRKIGIELDPILFSQFSDTAGVEIHNQNFYDFRIDSDKELFFVGNPPYRTPAYSLTTHKNFVLELTRKYNVLGLREEAVFFILHTIDIILRSQRHKGEIHYILPKCILKNNSKFFQRFKRFLVEKCYFTSIVSIEGDEFDGVNQDLVCLSLRVDEHHPHQVKVLVDGEMVELVDYLCLEENDIIPFQKIFKRTYLGSVPCESLLMSVAGEPVAHFRDRLCKIIGNEILTIRDLYELLQYNGRFHLKVFDKPISDESVQDKLRIIMSYVKNIQAKTGILSEFRNTANYKQINGRTDVQYYFRCAKLKPGKNFVYELNPHPCKSFFFTGNPSSSSTDYFGFCDYDINRNVSPGANRTVPVDDVESNLTEPFKRWWRENTMEPFSDVFKYIIFVSQTQWYKERKRSHKRFYFGIPPAFIDMPRRTADIQIPQVNVPEFFNAHSAMQQGSFEFEN